MITEIEKAETAEDWAKRHFEETKADKNQLSFWYDKVKNKFTTPKTVIIPLTLEQFIWEMSDNYQAHEIEEFGKYIIKGIGKTFKGESGPFFMKGGRFSSKFTFNFPKVESLDDERAVGEHALNIIYNSMTSGCGIESEIVVREFIDPENQLPTIYEGMPLHTEFRVFYDFNKKKLLGIFNYWDTETMVKNLWEEKDRKTFKEYSKTIENNFETHKERVATVAEIELGGTEGFEGIWSFDFMLDTENRIWLIDAAEGEKSYYFEKLTNI